jgi:nucleoside-diphosphate-sugar epimerase
MEFSMAYSKLLVLGHSGFIGRTLMSLSENHISHGMEIEGISEDRIDLSSRESSEALARLFTPDTVVLMLSGIKRQLGDTHDNLSANIEMGVNVARSIGISPPGRLLYMSSAAVYGEALENTAINESTSLAPTSYYGIGKIATELILERSMSECGGEMLSLRPPLIYGYGDDSKSYGPSGFMDAALEGRDIVLWGEGEELRSFVYVEDLARMVLHLCFSSDTGSVNLANGSASTFQDAANFARELSSSSMQIGNRERSRPFVNHGFDTSRLNTLLPGFEFTPLSEGMKQTFQKLQERG